MILAGLSPDPDSAHRAAPRAGFVVLTDSDLESNDPLPLNFIRGPGAEAKIDLLEDAPSDAASLRRALGEPHSEPAATSAAQAATASGTKAAGRGGDRVGSPAVAATTNARHELGLEPQREPLRAAPSTVPLERHGTERRRGWGPFLLSVAVVFALGAATGWWLSVRPIEATARGGESSSSTQPDAAPAVAPDVPVLDAADTQTNGEPVRAPEPPTEVRAIGRPETDLPQEQPPDRVTAAFSPQNAGEDPAVRATDASGAPPASDPDDAAVVAVSSALIEARKIVEAAVNESAAELHQADPAVPVDAAPRRSRTTETMSPRVAPKRGPSYETYRRRKEELRRELDLP